MNQIIRSLCKNKSAFFTLILFTFLLSSCTHLAHLDRAQDAFSKGAQIENASLFNGASSSALSPESYYNLAYAEASMALKADGKLSKAEVLGTTYAIKALAAWKLKHYQEARELAKSALRDMDNLNKNNKSLISNGSKKIYTRDYAVMKALDPLITIQASNDSVYLFLNEVDPIGADAAIAMYKKLIQNTDSKGKIENAIKELDQVSAAVPPQHEVRTYFNLSQLAGLKVWSDAMDKLSEILIHHDALTESNETWLDGQGVVFEKQKKKYLDALAEKLPNGKEDRVYLNWKKIL